MHIFTALALAVEDKMGWPSMKTDQVKQLRPATGVAPLPVEKIYRVKTTY